MAELGGAGQAAAQSGQFTCTEMIGFSETAQWFQGGFISNIPDPKNWQLRWTEGGSVDLWANPGYAGWGGSALTVGRCSNGASAPDRVVMNVSGDYQTDPNWWASKTQQVIDIIRSRYPQVRQIALQPVVGAPNGQRCPSNDPQASLGAVRASYNYPYIKQGLAMVVGGDVVLGADPQVQSCAQYGDGIGHLPPASAAYVGSNVAAFWASGPTPAAPAPAPAAAPAPAPAPAPASVPAPAVASDGSLTVNFQDLGDPNRPLTGQYPGGVIDWGGGAWWLSGPYGAFAAQSVSFNGDGPTSASFSLLAPRRLAQLDVYNGGTDATTVTLSCDGSVGTQASLAVGQSATLPSGFDGPCGSVTVSSSNGWATNFDNLVLDPPSPTAAQQSGPAGSGSSSGGGSSN